VEVVGAAVDELLNELGDIGTSSPLGRQVANLLLGGDLTGQEKPEETLGQGLLTTGSLGQELLALGDLGITVSTWRVDIEMGDHLRYSHGNGYPPQSRGRNPMKKKSG
jgi:hypothetical protein